MSDPEQCDVPMGESCGGGCRPPVGGVYQTSHNSLLVGFDSLDPETLFTCEGNSKAADSCCGFLTLGGGTED